MIELCDIQASFGQFRLRDINLRVQPGQYCVLLGPPGSGKTSIVEMICGLRAAEGGTIRLGGRRADGLDPADRHVGYVPQDYALFTSMSVWRNIAFGLRVRRLSRAQCEQRVEQVASRLGIEPLLGRTCAGLSGGERQRVALARALVLEPQVLLLDEPVSALDESTRQRVCLELRALHDSLGMTTVHVSHNFEETHSVADLIAVLNDGRLAQVGSVDDVFRRPADEFVARFVRAGNVLRRVSGAEGLTAALLRPQDATLLVEGSAVPPGRAALAGQVVAVQDGGGLQWMVRVAVADQPDTVAVAVPRPIDDAPPPFRAGQRVIVTFDPARLHSLGPGDGPDAM